MQQQRQPGLDFVLWRIELELRLHVVFERHHRGRFRRNIANPEGSGSDPHGCHEDDQWVARDVGPPEDL